VVGGCTSSRIQFTHSLKAPGFNPWNLSSENLVSRFAASSSTLYRYIVVGLCTLNQVDP
jgi:hypothetical protein